MVSLLSLMLDSYKSGFSIREKAIYCLGDDVLVENQLALDSVECLWFLSQLSFM